ncbi:YwpF family protein [Alteribacillus sp. HJP-4]|uniref:YwpF family protein n=1 Tax=Alteribacillus sp. HJP-4 TaxID=2775394 RepID=UPI0035CD1991
MKTFRLRSLQFFIEEEKSIELKDVPVIEGLIINREEDDGSWLLEAVIKTEHLAAFSAWKQAETLLIFEVVITHPENEPAMMKGTIRDILELNSNLSVMIDAKMAAGKDDISTMLLENLIKEGRSGEELLKEFSKRKTDQRGWSKKIAENLYKQAGQG